MSAHRLLAATLAVLLLAAGARAEGINPFELKVGQTGPLSPGNAVFATRYEVQEVLGDDEMVVFCLYRGNDSPPFIVKGVATKGLADGSKYQPEGQFEVTGTRKLGLRTVFLVEKKG